MNRFLASIQTVRCTLRAGIRTSILFAFGLGIWSGISVIPHTDSSLAHESFVQYSMAVGDVAWAAGGGGPDASAAKSPENTSDTGVSFINGAFNVMFAIITPFLMLAGWLLTPDWTFGQVFGLRSVLHDLWVLISNVVYIIFAFLLIAMAFMNIYAGEKNTWAIKAKLPKLIVGVISVPFTWFFVSAILSVSSILTASAIQLAGDLRVESSTSKELEIPIYENCTIDFTASPSQSTESAGGKKESKFFNCKNEKSTPLSKLLASENAFGIVSYYAYGVFKIQDYKTITGTNIPSVKSIFDLSVQLIISILMFIMFFLIVIALVFALFMRALYFWAIAIASPLLSLRYFFDGKLGGFGDKWLSVWSILGLAMVPVYVAGALAFGLIFVSAVGNANLWSDGGGQSRYVTEIKKWEGDSQDITIFGTKYTVIGKPVGAETVGDATTFAGGFLGKLIINIIALGVLWFAVMAALKGSEITKEAAAPIASFGEEIGKLAKKLPQYAPIIPTKHGAASVSSLPNIATTVRSSIEGQAANRGQDIGQSIARAMGVQWRETVQAIQRIGAVPPVDNRDAGNKITEMLRASRAQDLADFASASKNQERQAIARYIDRFPDTIIASADRTSIKNKLQSNNQEQVRQALQELEHKIGQAHLGGGTADFNTINEANAFFAHLQWGNRSQAASSNPIQPIQVMLGQQAQPIQIQLSPDGKITWIDQTAEAAIRSYAAANAAMKPAIRQELENAIDTRNQWLTRAKQLTQAEISAILDSIIR